MKKVLFLVGALLLMCACNTNSPSADITAPLTQEEEETIRQKFADNYDCLIAYLDGYKGCELELRRIYAATDEDAYYVYFITSPCFGEKYAHPEGDMVDNIFVDKSYMKQRVYVVDVWSKWKQRQLHENEFGNQHLCFDRKFNLIPSRVVEIDTICGCDCWNDKHFNLQ